MFVQKKTPKILKIRKNGTIKTKQLILHYENPFWIKYGTVSRKTSKLDFENGFFREYKYHFSRTKM